MAQAFAAGSMKHGGGSRRGSTKPDDWPGGGKGDRDRRDKDRDRGERDRDRDRDKPKEKLDARKLQVLLKHREKKEPGVSIDIVEHAIYWDKFEKSTSVRLCSGIRSNIVYPKHFHYAIMFAYIHV